MGQKAHLRHIECCMVVGARLDGLQKTGVWDFPTQTSLEFTENEPKKRKYFQVRGQKRITRILRADRITRVTQKITHYD